ncbi:MAG: FecR family protein [Tannerellaceae bacterium]|jgi:ferric-dicitrate binding protein FerR (iron transport regulator)|nr:FecR family protein [Tannerellaceae bacterium]
MNFDYKLLVKYLTDELSTEELSVVMIWRKENQEHDECFRQLVQLKISRKFDYYNKPEKIEEAFGTFKKQVQRKSFKHFIRIYFKYAAIVLFVLSIAFYSLIYIQEESYITYSIKESGEIKKITLDDGTMVWLNKGSILKLPKSFSDQNRNVTLKGEAYFDVKKNQVSPFVVKTEHMNVKVLGTSFTIKTNNKDKKVETILVFGEVTLLDKKDKIVYQMSPGEKVTYSSIQNKYEIESVDTNVSTAWHLNQFIFENISLREIVNKLALKFNVNINLESKTLADKRLRCVINEDESLIETLDILKYLIPIRYRVEENEVFISE